MAITKETEISKIEGVGPFKHVQVRIDTVVKEDGVEIGRKRWRGSYEANMDISNAHEEVKKAAETRRKHINQQLDD